MKTDIKQQIESGITDAAGSKTLNSTASDIKEALFILKDFYDRLIKDSANNKADQGAKVSAKLLMEEIVNETKLSESEISAAAKVLSFLGETPGTLELEFMDTLPMVGMFIATAQASIANEVRALTPFEREMRKDATKVIDTVIDKVNESQVSNLQQIANELNIDGGVNDIIDAIVTESLGAEHIYTGLYIQPINLVSVVMAQNAHRLLKLYTDRLEAGDTIKSAVLTSVAQTIKENEDIIIPEMFEYITKSMFDYSDRLINSYSAYAEFSALSSTEKIKWLSANFKGIKGMTTMVEEKIENGKLPVWLHSILGDEYTATELENVCISMSMLQTMFEGIFSNILSDIVNVGITEELRLHNNEFKDDKSKQIGLDFDLALTAPIGAESLECGKQGAFIKSLSYTKKVIEEMFNIDLNLNTEEFEKEATRLIELTLNNNDVFMKTIGAETVDFVSIIASDEGPKELLGLFNTILEFVKEGGK